MSGANYHCPNCDGRLRVSDEPQTYECGRCDIQIRESVCDRMERFERVARDDDNPLQEIARAALGRDDS